MKYFASLKKAMGLSVLSILCLTIKGQTYSTGPVYVEGKQTYFDMRHVNWDEMKGLIPRHISSTRGVNVGVKWIDRIGNMPDYLLDFYSEYEIKVKEVLNGQPNWLSDPTLGTSSDGRYFVTIKDLSGSVDFTFTPNAGNDEIKESASNAASSACGSIISEADCFIRYLVLCLNYDFPEAFWTGNGAQWGNSYSYGWTYNPSEGKGTVNYNLYITFMLKAGDFDYRISGFRTQELIDNAVTEFNSKVSSIVDLFKGKKRYDQVAGLNDWLTTHNSYNSDLIQTGTADEIAWSPLSALRESTGALGPVCEGYARAFKILCDKANIPCVLATGDAKSSKNSTGEGHMWNETMMDDEKWYAVDVTWNDPTSFGPESNQKESGYENHSWLLLGKLDVVSTDLTFAESHPNRIPGEGTSYQSEWDLSFGSLIEDNAYQPPTTQYASITFSKGMTTYTSEYNLDFSSLGDDVKAYIATGYDYDNGTIWLTRVKDVPAGTPILVKGEPSHTYDVPVKSSSGCYYKNMLVGNLSGEIKLSPTTGDMTNYYLSNGMFLTATGTNTIGNGKAYLQIPTTPPAATVGSSQSVKLNDYGFASFCGSQDLDFTDVEGLKAFAVTGYDDADGTIWLTRVKRVSAQTPLLLKGESKGSYSVPSVAVGSYYANMLKGNLSGDEMRIYTTDGDMTNYYLKGNQLLKAATGEGNKIDNGKAYMQIPSKHVTRSLENIVDNLIYGISDDDPEVISMPVVGSRGFAGDDTTVIHEPFQSEETNEVYYNLQGQRVDKPTKGLYIKNGRKVVIK